MVPDESLEKLVNSLELTAAKVRKHIIEMTYEAGSGHPGGSLSATDIITALYFHVMRYERNNLNRDRFILSKGHAAPALYAVLAEAGLIPIEELKTLRKIGSRLQGHPSSAFLPYVEISTGSLGQGLSVANGIALAGKLDKRGYRVYVLLGDGEIQEGQVWEAAMTAGNYKLDNLCAILDYNHLQIDGKVSEVMNIKPVKEKWEAFGWNTLVVDGHDFYKLIRAFDEARNTKDVPTIIIAQTTKGKGVSFMENEVGWHGKAPNEEQKEIALNEINAVLESLKIKPTISLKVKTPPKSIETEPERESYELPTFERGSMVKTRVAYGITLAALGDAFPEIVVLDADLASSTQSKKFGEKYPDRFFNMGISEADMIGTAAGFATCGKRPFASTFAVFATGRTYDQIRNSVAYSNLPVVIAGSHGGLITGEDGASHIPLEDIALMRVLPNMTVINPSDAVEMAKAVEATLSHNGPVYIRMYRANLPVIHHNSYEFKIGKGEILREGEDIAIIATGDMVFRALNAAKRLEIEEDISAYVANMPTIKPIDEELIQYLANRTDAILTVEDHSVIGGLGDAVRDVLPNDVPFFKMGVKDTFAESGKPEELIKKYGLSEEHIFERAVKLYGRW
ncbi:MAG: transketolase [Nanoarchaeota archaeon]|nr:transketolase [Nanoarchaeota archaeon]